MAISRECSGPGQIPGGGQRVGARRESGDVKEAASAKREAAGANRACSREGQRTGGDRGEVRVGVGP